MRNLHHLLLTHYLHWSHHLRDISGDHRADQNLIHVHYLKDDLVRTLATTCSQERCLKQYQWHQHIGMRKVHQSSIGRPVILMMTALNKDLKSLTNVVSLSISTLRYSNSWRCQVLQLYDDDTCMDLLVSCKGKVLLLHQLNLILISSSPLCREALLYSY